MREKAQSGLVKGLDKEADKVTTSAKADYDARKNRHGLVKAGAAKHRI